MLPIMKESLSQGTVAEAARVATAERAEEEHISISISLSGKPVHLLEKEKLLSFTFLPVHTTQPKD